MWIASVFADLDWHCPALEDGSKLCVHVYAVDKISLYGLFGHCAGMCVFGRYPVTQTQSMGHMAFPWHMPRNHKRNARMRAFRSCSDWSECPGCGCGWSGQLSTPARCSQCLQRPPPLGPVAALIMFIVIVSSHQGQSLSPGLVFTSVAMAVVINSKGSKGSYSFQMSGSIGGETGQALGAPVDLAFWLVYFFLCEYWTAMGKGGGEVLPLFVSSMGWLQLFRIPTVPLDGCHFQCPWLKRSMYECELLAV